ncbi:MAG: SoxR reducing system RseC family protein [Pseudomonadota bacterium]
MNKSTGRVVSVNGGRATVKVAAEIVCPRCAAGKGCGAGLLGRGERNELIDVLVAPHAGIREGDTVDVMLESRSLLRASALVYGLPLVSAVVAAAIGWGLKLSETGTVVMALAGLAAGLCYARRRVRSESCLREFTPTAAPSS